MTEKAPLAIHDTAQLTLLDVEFDPKTIDVDSIVPFAAADADTMLQILQVRNHIGELLFAREEALAVADVAEIEAAEQEKRAAADEALPDRQLSAAGRGMLRGQARRNRIIAARERFRAGQRELEILAHLKRKDGGKVAEE